MDYYTIQEQIAGLKSKPQLNRRERRFLAKLEGKLQSRSEVKLNWKGLLTKILFILSGIILIGGLASFVKTQPSLPPIDIQGHVEQNPKSHVLNDPMPEPIQKHMLEHADGEGAPSIIIQYNCKKYTCEKDLVGKLKALVKKYPQNVYLAPGDYDGKIILTRLGKREILDSFAEKRIIDFISQ